MADSQHTTPHASKGKGAQPSRRGVIARAAAVVAVPALAGSPTLSSTPDETTQLCRLWCALERESDALWDEWSDIESRLATQHADFFKLSDAGRYALPNGGARMMEIEQTGERLAATRERLLPRLPRLKAKTPEAVIAKLTVVTHLLFHDEHPEAHRIVKDSIRDLCRLLELRA